MSRPWHRPVYIFQMGKVGSTAVAEALRAPQVHVFTFRGIVESLKGGIYRHQLDSLRMRFDQNYKVITLVRDPVARNLSAFMQNHQSHRWEPTKSSFLSHFRHDEALTWFDEELKTALGIDVYEHPFPHLNGWQAINNRLLILRSESDDEIKSKAISEFLSTSVTIKRSNVSRNKSYASAYEDLKRSVLPREYIESMLNSKYARHFYTSEERQHLIESWLLESVARKSV